MTTAPVVIIPCSSKAAYLSRYAEPDKGWTDQDEARWPVPFWHMDAAMASLLILLTAVDEGLGACFFGIPPEHEQATRDAFGIPADFDPVGAITLGHRVPEEAPSGSPTKRSAQGPGGRRTPGPLDVLTRPQSTGTAPPGQRAGPGQTSQFRDRARRHACRLAPNDTVFHKNPVDWCQTTGVCTGQTGTTFQA